MMNTDVLLEGLTEAQTEAVRHVDGPLLVLAGPGSGKTTVVTRRVAWLVSQGIPAWQILALTFTNKAAAEMRQRIDALLPADLPGRRGLTVSTFHSFCVRLLRRHAEAARLAPRFSIYDAADQRDLLKRSLARAGLSSTNWTPAAVGSAISNAKSRLQDASAFAEQAGDFYERSIAKAYREYEQLLAENDALDFDDLLLRAARLLRKDPEVRGMLQQRYQYILIDEYQDTNHAQFMIAHVLAAEHRNLCVVGDPDQSIYGWRGPDISKILEFEQQYPRARIVPLGQNFRSTAMIVETAARLIACNRRRKDKRLFTELGEGERPVVVTCRDEHHEAELVVDEMRRRHDEDGIPWKQMAVLYRVNALSRVLEEAFRNASVPYVIARGTAFYARKEVKDALAYLRLVVNQNDEVSLQRIVNDPPRGIGRTTLQRVESFAVSRQLSLMGAMERAAEVPDLSARAVASVRAFVEMVAGWRSAADALAVDGEPRRQLAELVERVVRESGLEKHYKSSRSEEDQQRLLNLVELINAAADFPGAPEDEGPEDAAAAPPAEPLILDELAAWLEAVTLVSDADAVDPQRGSVTLMTLHTAKGLEFDVVAIAGLEEGLLPHTRAAQSEAELEEERRLCFVGITRARRHLLLSRAGVRTRRGLRERTIASQFLRELPEECIVRSELADDWDAIDEPRTPEEWERPARRSGRPGAGDWFVGCLVRHPTFGLGRIETLMPRPMGCAAKVALESGRVKTLILEYAKLERVE
jgi:DNA helicase-2/ATP-dependent DNA helicase PcrA